MAKQNKEKLNFVDAIIHELKTSLTAIIVSAELLGEELKPDEKSVLGRLIQSVIRNAHSINERLSLLSETGELLTENARFQPEPVEIGQVVQNITAQLYPEIQRRRQSLTLEVSDSLPAARADRQYLEQILQTLIANASKYTAEEGKIKVSAYRDGANLVVEVNDTGVGIPPEEQERVFIPYYQVSRIDEERRHKSSGLGLAIAKFLVELHGGKIWLKSTVGQGSSFFFSLPTVVSVESSSR
jgi:two-component system clock-associated histidine kinase SasA